MPKSIKNTGIDINETKKEILPFANKKTLKN